MSVGCDRSGVYYHDIEKSTYVYMIWQGQMKVVMIINTLFVAMYLDTNFISKGLHYRHENDPLIHLFDLDIQDIWRSWWYMKHHLIILRLHTKYHKSKDKRVTAWIREFPKLNFLTLRSEVKIMWRSRRPMIQHLMIIHLHTK